MVVRDVDVPNAGFGEQERLGSHPWRVGRVENHVIKMRIDVVFFQCIAKFSICGSIKLPHVF